MNDAVYPESGAADTMNENVELPVDLDSMAVGNTTPEAGDKVEVKVSGYVTRVVNKVAYVKPESVNDVPMPAAPLEPNPMVAEDERLKQLSEMAGPVY